MQSDKPMTPEIRDLLYQIKFGSSAQRNEAIRSAPLVGVRAIPALSSLMITQANPPEFRSAQEAVRKIVLNAYRANGESSSATAELARLSGPSQPEALRREAVEMLGLAADSGAVEAAASLLSDAGLRDEARMSLERLPFKEAEKALREARSRADGPWREALEYSLRKRRLTMRDVGIRR